MNVSDYSREMLTRHDICVLGGLNLGISALSHALRWLEHRGRIRLADPAPARAPALVASGHAAPASGPWSEAQARRLLAAAGVPVVPGELAGSAQQAVAIAGRVGWPVALKICSAQITHKSDIGGVLLGLSSEAEVRAGYEKVRAAGEAVPGASIEGVLVTPMRSGGAELLAGVTVDPTFGPVLAVGLGGIWVEILNDTSLRVLPVGAAEITRMLGELRGWPLLQGARGTPPGQPRRGGRGHRRARRRRPVAERHAARAGSQPAVGERRPGRGARRPGGHRSRASQRAAGGDWTEERRRSDEGPPRQVARPARSRLEGGPEASEGQRMISAEQEELRAAGSQPAVGERRPGRGAGRPRGHWPFRNRPFRNGATDMILGVSAEQEELRASVRRFLADRAPLSRVRELMATENGTDLAVWEQAGTQLGLQGLAIPSSYGGSGFTFAEQAIVLEEFGAALYGGPYLASAVLAATALLASQDEGARRELLPPVASGERIATLAFTEDGGSWDPGTIRLSAVKDGGDWRLDGHKSFVLDGHAAGLILVAATTDAGLSLFAVDGSAAGLRRTTLPTLDQTRKLARLEFAGVTGALIGSPGDAAAVLDRTLDVAAIALAAEQLGGAQRALDMAVAYAKIRHQFGRPIGSFQAIKHRCADLLLEVESLRSAVGYAAAAVAADSPEIPVLASLIKAYAAETYFHVAAENIQIHGGIAFTWEHDAHLYFKRAKSSELFLGDGSYHRERLAARIGL